MISRWKLKSKKVSFKKIAGILAKNKNIVFCSIFGSASEGNIRHGSDLDIAVYFYKTENYENHAGLLSEISTAINFDNLDFVDLNSTQNVVLAFEAVSGNIIYNADPDKTAEFVSYVSRMYEDRDAA